MSGRVGDLSPKQEEALAKVSPILARPRPGGGGPFPPAGGLGWGTSDRPGARRAAAGAAAGDTWARRSLRPLRAPAEGSGEVCAPRPVPAPSEPSEAPPGKTRGLGSPWRQLGAQRRHSSRGWQPGPRFPSMSRRISCSRAGAPMGRALDSSPGGPCPGSKAPGGRGHARPAPVCPLMS